MKPCNFDQIRQDTAMAARRTFATFRELHPDETFYAYALYTDDDAGAATPAASTEESLRRAIEKYNSGGYKLPEIGWLRYSPDEWAYTGAEGNVDEWAAIWEMNETLSDGSIIPFLYYKERALEAMIRALQDLDAEGFFGVGAAREAVTVLIWITDSAEAEKWWVRSAKLINPKSVYERFVCELPSWCKVRA